MKPYRTRLVAACMLAVIAVTAQAQTYTKPKVRAITAFVRLDPATFAARIAAALSVLRAAQQELGTGLDTIPYPGDISVGQLERIFGAKWVERSINPCLEISVLIAGFSR